MNSQLAIPVEQSMIQFCKIADSHKQVRWEAESQFALQALSKNSGLQACTPDSIQNAVINIAAVGLTLNPADGYAYLVPEYNKDTKKKECVLRVSFKGLIKAATDTGVVEWVRAEIVREADTFTFLGMDQRPVHEMKPFEDRGDPKGVYCIAKLATGDYMVEVMEWAEVTKIRECAKTKMVWDAWPFEMAKKAIIKRAAKQWPKSSASSILHKTIEVINDSEGSDDPITKINAIADEIESLLEQGDLMGVGQIWCECDEREQSALWTAKTKGGFFTKDQKDDIRKAASGYRRANEEAIEGESEVLEESAA